MSERWLIVGLGNPGSKYERTRHNAGFWFLNGVIDRADVRLRLQPKLIAEVGRADWHGAACVLCRPRTFMNESGQAVRAVADYFDLPVARMLVAYDDLDLPPGTIRLKQGGGHGGHNGLRSLFSHLGDQNFWRLRIGIGHPGHRDAVTPWVLSRAPADDEDAIQSAIRRAVSVMPEFLAGNTEVAVKDLHTSADMP